MNQAVPFFNFMDEAKISCPPKPFGRNRPFPVEFSELLRVLIKPWLLQVHRLITSNTAVKRGWKDEDLSWYRGYKVSYQMDL
jgi:hypothetical protein